MTQYRSSRDLDWMLLLLTLAICGLGILQIYSATIGTVWKNDWWKQTLYVLVGLAIMNVVARIDYHALLEHVPVFYIVSLVTLVRGSGIGPPGFRLAALGPVAGRFHLAGVGVR